jgi:hypothetical protein
MNNGRRPIRAACLRRRDRVSGDERDDDELQSDQRAGRRTDDDVEVPPSGKG